MSNFMLWQLGAFLADRLFPRIPDMPQANDRQVGGDHYRKHGAALQHWDLVAMFGWDYFQGQIIKYLMRWRDKNGVQDLEKAAHYLQKYIEAESSEEARTVQGLAKHAAEKPVPDMPRELDIQTSGDDLPTGLARHAVEKQYAEPGQVSPTGWTGYTFEGADEKGFHFRCKQCKERFYVPPEGNPHNVHDTKCEYMPMFSNGEPTAAYVNQDEQGLGVTTEPDPVPEAGPVGGLKSS